MLLEENDCTYIVFITRCIIATHSIHFIVLFYHNFIINFTLQHVTMSTFLFNALLKSDVTRRDHVSVVMDAGSRIVNFIVNFIRDGTVFA